MMQRPTIFNTFKSEIAPLKKTTTLLFASTLLLPTTALARESEPVWEFGVAGVALAGQDYPASDQANDRVLAAPYFIYRGERFRLGEGGLQAIALENPRYRFELSAAGSLDANSEGNPLREGMPDLDFLFEIGPQLIITLDKQTMPDQSERTSELAVQLRGAFSTDFRGVDALGPVASLALTYEREGLLGGRLDIDVEYNAVFADERLHDLFYQVDPEFVTPTRPAFDAESGYLGSDLSLGGFYYVRDNLGVFSGVSWNSFSGAANEESSLFETDSSVNAWLGLIWRLRESEQRTSTR